MDLSSNEESVLDHMQGALQRNIITRSPVHTRHGKNYKAINKHNKHAYIQHFKKGLRKQCKNLKPRTLSNDKENDKHGTKDDDNLNSEAVGHRQEKTSSGSDAFETFQEELNTVLATSANAQPELVTPSRWVYQTPKRRQQFRFASLTKNNFSLFSSTSVPSAESVPSDVLADITMDSGTMSASSNSNSVKELQNSDFDVMNDSAIVEEFNKSFDGSGDECPVASASFSKDDMEMFIPVVELIEEVKEESMEGVEVQIPECHRLVYQEEDGRVYGNPSVNEYKWYNEQLQNLSQCFHRPQEMEEASKDKVKIALDSES